MSITLKYSNKKHNLEKPALHNFLKNIWLTAPKVATMVNQTSATD